VKVDRQVERLGSEAPDERGLAEYSRQPADARRDNHLVEVWVAFDNGGGRRFDDVGDVGGGEASPDRAKRWSRENDVTNLTQSHQQNPH
jgi:hypothetical protein